MTFTTLKVCSYRAKAKTSERDQRKIFNHERHFSLSFSPQCEWALNENFRNLLVFLSTSDASLAGGGGNVCVCITGCIMVGGAVVLDFISGFSMIGRCGARGVRLAAQILLNPP